MASFEEIKRVQASATETVPAGTIQAFAGLVAPTGWHLCDGTVLEQGDYAKLYANIGSNWDTFAHPVDGTPTVGGSQFALPNLKGLYLAGAGDGGGDARTVGAFQAQKTAKNGLTGNFASDSHSHGGGTLYPSIHFGAGVGWSSMYIDDNTQAKDVTGYYVFNSASTGSWAGTASNLKTPYIYGNTGTPSASGSLSSTDAETRPVTAPVSYIIKL